LLLELDSQPARQVLAVTEQRIFPLLPQGALLSQQPSLCLLCCTALVSLLLQSAGDIVALFGIECASGDTFTDGSVNFAMTSIRVPDPVMSVSLTPKSTDQLPNFQRALQRFQREDPTFTVSNNAGERTGLCLLYSSSSRWP
jgi:hypothetical protein